MKKRRTLRFRKTALTLLLSVGLFSSPASAHAAELPHDAAQRLYFVSQDARDSVCLVSEEKSRKRSVGSKKSPDVLLAGIIGADVEYIKRERSGGKSLEQIAEESGAAGEFREAVMRARNSRLKELFREGRITGEELEQMYDNADFIAIPLYDRKNAAVREEEESAGNAALLLAEVLDESTEAIEERLNSGATPWEIARRAGRFEEYKDAMLENLISALDDQVANGCMTREEADERIADFEFEFTQI